MITLLDQKQDCFQVQENPSLGWALQKLRWRLRNREVQNLLARCCMVRMWVKIMPQDGDTYLLNGKSWPLMMEDHLSFPISVGKAMFITKCILHSLIIELIAPVWLRAEAHGYEMETFNWIETNVECFTSMGICAWTFHDSLACHECWSY